MDSIDDDAYESDLLNLVYELQQLEGQLGIRLSDAATLAILQKYPCYARIVDELVKPIWSNIDRLYLDRHNFAKIKTVDRIVAEFGNRATIKSEYDLSTGNMDVVLLVPPKNVSSKEKTIGVEIKAGSSVDVFEIERYIFAVDYLLLARIPTRQIELLDRNAMKAALRTEMMSLTDKVRRIAGGNRIKVEGPWCKGCPLNCEFKKRSYDNSKAATLEFGLFKENLDLTVENLITELRKVIGV